MRLPLAPVEWACLAFGVLAAHGFLVHEWLYPSAWDATQYFHMGREVAARGVFSNVEGYGMRTYAYPLLVSLAIRAAAWSGASFVALLFAAQLSAFVAAAFLLRRALAPAAPTAARWAFCGLLVNYYALIYTPESLTESASLTLLVITAAAWITLWRRGLGAGPLVAGSLAAGFALMIRPANAYLVAAWAFGAAVLYARQRPAPLRGTLLAAFALIALALPVVPQVAINALHYGRATPFVTADLGLLQQVLGIRYLKYATALPPIPEPTVPYENPLVQGTTLSETSPLAWYGEYPLRGAATLALHTFNLTDQDLLFTYSRDLDPWYRVPLGIVNHAVVALGVLGAILLARRVRAARDPRLRDAAIVLLALVAANWLVYAWTAVEMRFGAVLLLVLFPFACFAGVRIAQTKRRAAAAMAVVGVSLYVALALLLSGWIRDQAPAIRKASALHAGPVTNVIAATR